MKNSLIWKAAVLCLVVSLRIRANAQYVIDSLDGDVTQHEVDVFLSTASATPIPVSHWAVGTPSHNQLAYFAGGALEAINDMYVLTGDLGMNTEHAQLLNLAIKWNDAWLIHRNDMPLGEHRVMWTGNADPIWPPNPPTHVHAQYVGSETGDTVGHLAYTLLNIARTPSIWNKVVPDGDPNHFGATYRERAKTYETMLEFSMSNYFNKYFI